jgi:hypothetical protein
MIIFAGCYRLVHRIYLRVTGGLPEFHGKGKITALYPSMVKELDYRPIRWRRVGVRNYFTIEMVARTSPSRLGRRSGM